MIAVDAGVEESCARSVLELVLLSKRRTQLTGIEPAMGCDSGPPNWVGGPVVCVSQRHAQHDSLASIEWMLARTCDGGGMNKR